MICQVEVEDNGMSCVVLVQFTCYWKSPLSIINMFRLSIMQDFPSSFLEYIGQLALYSTYDGFRQGFFNERGRTRNRHCEPPTHLNPFAEGIEKPVRKIGPPPPNTILV